MRHPFSKNMPEEAERDEMIFQELFIAYYPSLYSFAFRYVTEDMVAEDIVQDVFVKLWETKERVEHIDDLSAYLYQMVRFKCFNHLRAQKIRDNAAQKFVTEQEVSDTDAYIMEETYRLVIKTMEDLPPACRNVITLSMQGFSAKDIAEQLNIAVETVKKQKQIARKVLKEKLGKLLLFIPMI